MLVLCEDQEMTKVYTIEYTSLMGFGTWCDIHPNSQEALAQFYLDMGYGVEIELFSVEVL